eukprot:g25412.t1
MKAAQALVGRFGDLCPDLLMAAFEGSYAKALGSSGDWKKMQIVREKSMQLLFGQDLLTCDECSNKATRLRVLILSFVARSDPDAAVKRVASNVWKTSGGSPKMQSCGSTEQRTKTIIKELSESILKWRAGSMGAGLQKVAKDALAELVKAGDLEEPSEDAEAVTGDFAFEVAQSNSAEAARIAAGQGSDSPADEADIKEDCQMVKKVENFWNKQALFGSLPGDLKSHALSVSESVIREGHKKKLPGPKELQLALQMICQCCKEQVEEFCKSLPDNVEALCREVLGEDFEGQHHEGYDAGTLLRVENMMYGAGKLLLKDTMLEMKANRRYGVVGHNGAGKTTLMKDGQKASQTVWAEESSEIVAGRIVGMPTHLRCVHVDDSKLGEMSKSSLNALEYVQKKAMEIGVTDASAENLRTVGFPEKMFEVPVAELSTGWRMRLTLAPTNHLDQESVDWLGDYLLQLTRSSVMVISHEPKICTDIISYKDRQLVYTEGNFDAFVMAKGIKADDIEALLSGNLKLDEDQGKGYTAFVKEEGEEGAEEAAKAAVQAPITGPPKISFPIPGSVEGVKSSSKAVIEFKNLSFRYGKDKDYLITDVAGKLSLGSRVAMLVMKPEGKHSG